MRDMTPAELAQALIDRLEMEVAELKFCISTATKEYQDWLKRPEPEPTFCPCPDDPRYTQLRYWSDKIDKLSKELQVTEQMRKFVQRHFLKYISE